MADLMVKRVQEWLNNEYGNTEGFVIVDEDGLTGNSTIKALIRALQIELEVSIDGIMGNDTLNLLPDLSTKTDTSIPKNKNLVYILQGAMYCKGYNPNGFDGLYGTGASNAIKEFKNDVGFENVDGVTTPNFFNALLNTDGFKLDPQKGDSSVRTIQQALNRQYSSHFQFVPTNGVYGKFTNKGLIKAIQVEQGTTPDGIFGTNTLNNCPVLKRYGVVTNRNFVYLLQYTLYCNQCDPNGFDGGFGAGVEKAVKKFQTFVGLTADGIVGKDTWASLLISCGNRDRKGKGCDTAYPITENFAKALVADGREIVGRYIGGGNWKRLTLEELNLIFSHGLKVFPIYQTVGTHATYFNSNQGKLDAFTAVNNARKLGFKSGTTIYFAVDFDAVDSDVTNYILPYFEAIFKYFQSPLSALAGYSIGVYGPRNICTRVSAKLYAVSSFVSDMSTGYSGNLGYLLPPNWFYDQIATVKLYYGPQVFSIDNLIVSQLGSAVSEISPTEKYLGMWLPDYIDYVDQNILSTKEQHINMAVEAIVSEILSEPESTNSFEEALLAMQETVRKKEECRYIFDEFMDDSGYFVLKLPEGTKDERDKYEFQLQEYQVYSLKDIQDMRKSDALVADLAGFIPIIGAGFSFIAQAVYDKTYEGKWVTVDNVVGYAQGKALDAVLNKFKVSENTQLWFSNLLSGNAVNDTVQRPPEDGENYYIVEYIPSPGGGSQDYGDTKFVIRAGDVYLNFKATYEGSYIGNYIVYLSKHDKYTERETKLSPQIVWFYSI